MCTVSNDIIHTNREHMYLSHVKLYVNLLSIKPVIIMTNVNNERGVTIA